MLLLFNKPFGILSQFTPEPGSAFGTLASFGFPASIYPVGRLDADSEGMLLLSDEKGLTSRLLDPSQAHWRTYWSQVEGTISDEALAGLRRGVMIGDYRTRPCRARRLHPAPTVHERIPPIRERKNVPVDWLELELIEGRNRQVRRMTASVGLPTLRLLRVRIGMLGLGDLAVGAWREVGAGERTLLFAQT